MKVSKMEKLVEFNKNWHFFLNLKGMMWAHPTLYHGARAGIQNSVLLEFNQDFKYGIELALSLKLRQFRPISALTPKLKMVFMVSI
jgi:hypothetical protein